MCFSRMTKTIPNKVGTKLKVSEVDHYQKIDDSEDFRWAVKFREDFEEPISAY